MEKVKLVKFEGSNEDLFVRICADNLDHNAKLIVPETHNAIRVIDGQYMDTLDSGAYDIFDGKKKKDIANYSVDVIFTSKTAKLQVFWGTRTQFSFRDTETDVPIKVGAHGEFEVQIDNPRKACLELIGAEKNYNLTNLKERLAMRMMSKIEPVIARTMREKKITYDRMSEHKDEIAQSILPELNEIFKKDYGLKMFSFTLGNVMISEEDIKAIEKARQDKAKKLEDEKLLAAQKQEEEAKNSEAWEKEKFLLQLKQTDYEKYLEVCKAIGWQPTDSKPVTAPTEDCKICSSCGYVSKGEGKFCPNCGALLGRTSKICPSCNKENALTAKFCKFCGAKLDN